MMGGGVLSYLVLIPMIKFFGSAGTAPLAPETAHSIAAMSVEQIQKGYILYIGAGAVATAGIISLFRSLPLIWHGLKGGLADLRGSGVRREERAAHRSGPLDEMGRRRGHRLAHRHDARAAIEPAL